MIDIKEIYDEMLKQEQFLKKQGFNDEQIMVIGKLLANKEYLEKQVEKKDRQIDLMANYIYAVDYRNECGKTRIQVKQYFEKEAENGD